MARTTNRLEVVDARTELTIDFNTVYGLLFAGRLAWVPDSVALSAIASGEIKGYKFNDGEDLLQGVIGSAEPLTPETIAELERLIAERLWTDTIDLPTVVFVDRFLPVEAFQLQNEPARIARELGYLGVNHG